MQCLTRHSAESSDTVGRTVPPNRSNPPANASEHDLNVIKTGQTWFREAGQTGDLFAGESYGQGTTNTPQMQYMHEQGIQFSGCPGAIGVQVQWHNLMSVDVVEGTFTARVLISYWWYDASFDTPVYENISKGGKKV